MAGSLVSALSGALLLLGSLPGTAAELKIGSRDEIIESSRSLARDMMSFYQGEKPGEVPGILPGPPYESANGGDYYWYMGGSFFASFIDYQHWTGDDSYQSLITKALAFQIGSNDNFMPANYTANMGNDDQCMWAQAALQAVEYKLPNAEGVPPWIDVVKNVFENMADPIRNDETCDGGLRWQIMFSNAGYDFKNSASNGCFLDLAARLARFTGNKTYADFAEKRWDWLVGVGFVDKETYAVYDGAHVDDNCTDISKLQFSYNAAFLVQGAAFMYNYTNGSSVWRERTQKLTDNLLDAFFPKGIAYESSCEGKEGRCSSDMLWYKGYVHRWLAVATQVAPFLADKVLPVLKTSAEAAAKQCVAGDSGLSNRCGFYWSEGKFVDPRKADNTTGIGEGISVLAAVSGLLINDAKAPVTGTTGGNGDPSGDGQSGSPSGTGTAGSSSPTSTPGGSGAGHVGADIKLSLLVGVLAAFAWAL